MMFYDIKETLLQSEIDYLIELLENDKEDSDLDNILIINKLRYMEEEQKKNEFLKTLVCSE